MKKAFTLIELLVVIAIIAILAAILFPVFAQAKVAAKQSSTLSNGKQLGTGFAIYTADADDLYPSALSQNGTQADSYWNNSYGFSFPAGSLDPSTYYYESEDKIAWPTAVLPYTKNVDIYSMIGGNRNTDLLASKTGPKPAVSTFMFNGLLHHYSGTAVASPSATPLLTQSWGSQQLIGRAWSNPAMPCYLAVGPCMFNPSGPPVAGGSATTGSQWIYYDSKSSVWSFKSGVIQVQTDSSAKFLNIGRGLGSATDPAAATSKQWFAKLTDKGVFDTTQGSATVVCSDAGTTIRYHCAFRPDYQR